MSHQQSQQTFLKRIIDLVWSTSGLIIIAAVAITAGVLCAEYQAGFSLTGDSVPMYGPQDLPDDFRMYGPAEVPSHEHESSRSSAALHSAAAVQSSVSGRARNGKTRSTSRR